VNNGVNAVKSDFGELVSPLFLERETGFEPATSSLGNCT